MSDHNNQGGKPGDIDAAKHEADAQAAQAKAAAVKAEKDAKVAAEAAKKADEAATEKAHEKAVSEGKADEKPASAPKTPAPAKELEVVEEPYQAKAKPELDEETQVALRRRAEEDKRRPAFRRQEWFRYQKLGGKNAPWRRPRGIHSKMRRHYKYRPNVASIGFRGPAAVRGLHPSGFEEVLVHRPEDLDAVDAKIQAARIGGTVGGRKAELITKKADDMGIRILNRRS